MSRLYPDPNEKNVLRAAAAAVSMARLPGAPNIDIFDTAGRQEIDDALIQELKELKEFLQPQETLLVVDAATGQQAVSVATHFQRRFRNHGNHSDETRRGCAWRRGLVDA